MTQFRSFHSLEVVLQTEIEKQIHFVTQFQVPGGPDQPDVWLDPQEVWEP